MKGGYDYRRKSVQKGGSIRPPECTCLGVLTHTVRTNKGLEMTGEAQLRVWADCPRSGLGGVSSSPLYLRTRQTVSAKWQKETTVLTPLGRWGGGETVRVTDRPRDHSNKTGYLCDIYDGTTELRRRMTDAALMRRPQPALQTKSACVFVPQS